MKIVEDVYKVVSGGNVYVILGSEPIVIDTGDAVDSRAIMSAVGKIVPLEDVKKVLLTHMHYDHAGNVAIFPNAEVYADAAEIENYRKSPKDFFFHGIAKEGDDILRNAKPLPTEISGLKVLKVPGHTRGSVAFLDEKRKLLFSGDTIFGNGVGRTDFPNSLPDEMNASVAELVELVKEDKLLLCSGHDY